MLSYFPSKTLLDQATGSDLAVAEPGQRVSISVAVFKLLVRSALASAPFDEEFYLATNPDLEKAWKDGKIEDLHQHYIETGYFEGRKGSRGNIDEEWYLSRYKDVALAVREGQIASVREHYEHSGEREWRAPNEAAAKPMQAWRQAILR